MTLNPILEEWGLADGGELNDKGRALWNAWHIKNDRFANIEMVLSVGVLNRMLSDEMNGIWHWRPCG